MTTTNDDDKVFFFFLLWIELNHLILSRRTMSIELALRARARRFVLSNTHDTHLGRKNVRKKRRGFLEKGGAASACFVYVVANVCNLPTIFFF